MILETVKGSDFESVPSKIFSPTSTLPQTLIVFIFASLVWFPACMKTNIPQKAPLSTAILNYFNPPFDPHKHWAE
jgi:hypothetical protein